MPLSTHSYPAHENKVFLTTLPLPQPSDYEYLEYIRIAGDITRSREDVLNQLARIGREVGADAIVEIKLAGTPLMGTERIERVTGKAVKLKSNLRDTLSVLNGEWR